MRKPSWWIPMAAATAVAAMAGCGSDGAGFYASGSLEVVLHDPATASPTRSGYRFPQQARIDATLPAGTTSGTTGRCLVGPTGRSLRLDSVGGEPGAVRQVELTLPPWEQDTAPNFQRTITATIGDTVFHGTQETTGASECRFTTAHHGSFGMDLTIQCAGMHTASDQRTMDINATMVLEECDGPETRQP